MTNKKSKVGIIGCGWLGLPLADYLINLDYIIKGSTTSKSKLGVLASKHIEAHHIQLTETDIYGDITIFLSGIETLVINIPPGLHKNPNKNHVSEIRHLISKINNSSVAHVLYISSTSVFEDAEHFPIITNQTKPNGTTNSAKQLIAIETLLKSNSNFKTTILRFSGLIDENRHPGNYLSNRKKLKNGNAPVNLIHKKDSIEIISAIIKQNAWELTFNASIPNHPSKENYYISYCKTHNLPLPEYVEKTKSKGKIIDSSFLVQHLKYRFKVSL